MTRRLRLACFALGGLIYLLAASLLNQARPHSWYPQACCSGQDCEAIPIDGVAETAEGFHVRYASPRFGPIDADIPAAKVKPSQDGRFHGCWRAGDKSNICFFAPLNA